MLNLAYMANASIVLYVAFILSLCFSHPFFFGWIGKAVLRDCGMSCVSLLIFVCLTLLVCGQALAYMLMWFVRFSVLLCFCFCDFICGVYGVLI